MISLNLHQEQYALCVNEYMHVIILCIVMRPLKSKKNCFKIEKYCQKIFYFWDLGTNKLIGAQFFVLKNRFAGSTKLFYFL